VKTIIGVVLSMRFAHRYGLCHGHLTGDNGVFDDDGLNQICHFCQDSLPEVGADSEAMAEVVGFSGENWRPAADVRAFAELLSRIIIGNSAEESGNSQSVPSFVLEMVERGQS
jgi:hypothetical protein